MKNISSLPRAAALALLLVTTTGWATAADAEKSEGKSFRAGLEFNGNASAEDTGLPTYPGARQKRDKDDDAEGINLDLRAGKFGMKLVVVKFESEDDAAKVAAFYKKALAKYGTVLDCNQPRAAEERREKGDGPRPLRCERDRSERNNLIYKAGTRQQQHIASIKPRATGATFELVYLEKSGDD